MGDIIINIWLSKLSSLMACFPEECEFRKLSFILRKKTSKAPPLGFSIIGPTCDSNVKAPTAASRAKLYFSVYYKS